MVLKVEFHSYVVVMTYISLKSGHLRILHEEEFCIIFIVIYYCLHHY